MGLYPAAIKTPTVLAAAPHPVVFQCYKSFWVFAVGWLLLLPRLVSRPDGEPLFVFTKWGLVGAATWIPSGLCTIISVPMIGMGNVMTLSAATSAVLSFVVFVSLGLAKVKS
jgi:hypothetical protein